MWTSIQFNLFLILSMIILLLNSTNIPRFALYSELTWLGIYMLTATLSVLVDSISLSSAPFVILILTAVEAVIIWSLVVLGSTQFSFKL